MDFTTKTELTTLVKFPVNYFLENLAVRSDNSLLITVLNHKELWFIPAAQQEAPTPIRLYTFEQAAMGIVEIEPDVFVICTSDLWGNHDSYLHRLDMRNWSPGAAVDVVKILQMEEPVRGLNGVSLVGAGVILVADSFAGLIWRIDISPGGHAAKARVWLKHISMNSLPDGPMPDQPGVNGLAYAMKSNFLYFTSTAQQLLMRVQVDADTLEPVGEPEFIADGMMGDDLCIDEDSQVAYVATHRQNTIDRIPLRPGQRGGKRNSVAGVPFTENLLGPTTGRWGRLPLQTGRVAFFLTDGGIKGPMPDGSLRQAQVLRVKF